MSAKERIEAFLRESKVPFQVHHHPTAFTAQEVAAAEHVSGKRLAKVVAVKGGEGLSMLVLPAPSMIDLEKAGAVLGGSARLADESEFASSFPDCDTGAMPPFGHLYDLPLYVDSSLADQDEIVFQAGTHTDTITMSYSDYARLAQPKVADFAVH